MNFCLLADVEETVTGVAEKTATLGQNLSDGVVTFVLGMGIVFCMLVLIIGCIKILTAALGTGKKKTVPKPEPVPEVPAPEIVMVPAESEEDEDEIVAVIAAAVACMAASEGKRLKIRSFRRVGTQSPAWNRAGRSDIVTNRF